MQPSSSSRRVIHFGPFEVDLDEGVLRKDGVNVRLQTQPFEVLAALLEKPGLVVTRAELRQRLWTENTFVDFEHGLNAAVTRLRQALGDSADQPRYIETLAKRGYRFIASVETRVAETAPRAPPDSVTKPKQRTLFRVAGMVLAGVAAVSFLVFRRVAHPVEPSASRVEQAVPLTAFRGIEANPALSPDGTQVAFTWNGERQDNFDIYVMPIGSDAPVRLTTNPSNDVSPAWSPDGHTIAFIRKLGGERGELILIPATGGPEHPLHEIRDFELTPSPGRLLSVAWSPDGGWIAASHRSPEDSAQRICLFSVTGEMRQLTAMPSHSGDHTPAFSADGRTLAFSRLGGFSTSEIYALPLNSELQPAGEARRLTSGNRWSVNPVWFAAEDRILYLTSDSPNAPHELRAITSRGRELSGRRMLLDDVSTEVTLGKHLIYSRTRSDANIWRAKIPRAGEPPSESKPLISSTWTDEKPRYSHDGTRIAFTSSRSGSPEIWVSKADGSSPIRMTSFGGPLVGYANWSPDGQWLVFHARREGQADLYVMPAIGGSPPKRLTTGIADDTMPSYSHDGRWIYFASARSGQNEIWRFPAAGGEAEAVQVTSSGGQTPLESPNGKHLVYMTLGRAEIRCIPAGGGSPFRVEAPIHRYPSAFDVTSLGVYYESPPHAGDQRFIQFFDFATRKSRPIAVARHPFIRGMSVSPDGEYVLFDQTDGYEGDLFLIRDFRL